MSSIEIAKQRKALEQRFQKEANILNGQLSDAKQMFEFEMKELQKECSHRWDTGEDAVQQLSTLNLCAICRKKFEK